jgi:TPR repeat protein
MTIKLIHCISLPPATILSVPIYDFAKANAELANEGMSQFYSCCGKSICNGCIHSFDNKICPFCNSDRQASRTDHELVEEITKRVEANDAGAICILADYYEHGEGSVQQDHAKAMHLYTRAAELGCANAHYNLGANYHIEVDLKKAKFHSEAAAMAGHELARYNLGAMECNSGNIERGIRHLTIAASAGNCHAMHELRTRFEKGVVNRESIDSTLTAYNNSCTEMRSKARDSYIQVMS